MYRSARILRIVISLLAMAVPTWALIAGYDSVFVRMQILTALLAGVAGSLIFWGVVTLVYGRIYCSTVCPMGTLIDCVSATSRITRRCGKDFRYRSPSRRTRFIFLIIAFATMLAGGSLLPTLLDPYSEYARMVEQLVMRPLGIDAPEVSFTIVSMLIAIGVATAVVAVSWRKGRLLCNSVCPVGTLLGIGSARAVFHIEIDPDRCVLCGRCEQVCKSQCIKLPERTVDNSRCVVCFDCTAICPNGAINYKTGRHALSTPLMQRLAQDGPQSEMNK